MAYSTGSKDTANVTSARRTFDLIGEKIHEIWPHEAPFQVFLNKLAKEPTIDPKPYKLVHEAGYVDKVFFSGGTGAESNWAVQKTVDGSDNVGFLIPGMVLRVKSTGGSTPGDVVLLVQTVDTQQQIDCDTVSGTIGDITDNDLVQVISTGFARGTDKATATYDTVSTEFSYTQIFKTVVDVTGTMKATELFGGSEYKRLMSDKAREHKVEIERQWVLGKISGTLVDASSNTVYLSEGMLGYIETNNTNIFTNEYGNYPWDDFVDDMETWYNKGGNRSTNEKLFLSGASVVSHFSKIGEGKLWADATVNMSIGEAAPGLRVYSITHPWGILNVVHEPVLRGDATNAFYKDYAIGVDMDNVFHMPLAGNGENRDTHIVYDLQTSYDKTIHQYLTEAALLPINYKTHAMMKFS